MSVVDIMQHITKIAAIETTSAIWEFDPTLPDNCLLGNSLDVIAAIRTVAVNVRLEYIYGFLLNLLANRSRHLVKGLSISSRSSWRLV